MKDDIYLGIMSGTSLDGIDVAACVFDNKHIELLSLYSEEWPVVIRERLLNFATAKEIEMDSFVQAHFELAQIYATAVKETLRKIDCNPSDIRAIGSHGQTVRHLPSTPMPATFQLGSGAALSALTNIDVVSDFRSADMALGGQGAPLVPMFDRYFLSSDSIDRLIVNIGGISNVTWLSAESEGKDVIAFDSGPGNMLIDALTRKYFDKPFDENGAIARAGKIDENILQEFLAHPFFATPPPKSTGRELFSEKFLSPIDRKISNHELSPRDAIATVTELTARTIARSFQFFPLHTKSAEIIISGGGALNAFLLQRLSMNFENNFLDTRILLSDSFGIPVKAKEAIAFAFFAKAFLEETPIHLPKTTGASRRLILGSLSKG